MQGLNVIVLAGGAGRRLAAVTRRLTGRDTPKQYCSFGSDRTLLQRTLDRLAPIAPSLRTTVVVQERHLALAREQLACFPGVTILSQPHDRGTGVGLLRALAHVLEDSPHALVLVTPADHGIRDNGAYRGAVADACAGAARASAVLLGAAADAPRTDHGWIVPAETISPGVRRVAAFVEKPPPREAEALARRGALYSTMVVVGRAARLFGLFERVRPGLAAVFRALPALPPPARDIHLRRAYGFVPQCDFSRDVLAVAPDLGVVRLPETAGWTDLGTPERLADWLDEDPAAALVR